MAADSNSARFTFAGEPLTAGDLVKIGYEGTAIRCTHADRPEGIVLENAHTGNEVLIHDISSGPSSTSAASTPTPSVADLMANINNAPRPFGNTPRPPRPRPWNGYSTPASPTGPPQPSISEMLRMLECDQWPLLPPTITISMSEDEYYISGSERRHPIRRLHDGLRHFGYDFHLDHDHPIRRLHDGLRHFGYDFHLDHDHSTRTTHFTFTKDRAIHPRPLRIFDADGSLRLTAAIGGENTPNPPLTVAPPAPKTLSYPVQNRRKITA